ncbi:MAG: M28 family peptidase [Pirellulaceae bacterium]
MNLTLENPNHFTVFHFNYFKPLAAGVLLLTCISSLANAQQADLLVEAPEKAAEKQAELVSEIRQLTFEGKRAGEGYFSADGSQMVFQSEREPGNPFFQIYLMDRENGDVRRVSPGIGKTTCAWIHPNGKKVVFASTQYDPKAVQKQKEEIAFRESGESRRYSWDYDETYDLVEFDVESGEYQQLTRATGYDAEGSYSPDGKLICFASNRRAYSGDLSEKEKELFEVDPASAMDIYIMNSDGTDVRRLTDVIGYDGGPFFSPDGQRICWRRFAENGATAEIMVMDLDGTGQRALTSLGHMSWAPYFHPSGDYLIFATNKHGFGNFELYLVDAAGSQEPVRVSYREGFDGLPVFTPDGNSLVWTSNGGNSQSQLFEATWDDAAARELLSLDDSDSPDPTAIAEANSSAKATAPEFSASDVGRHVDYLCRPELGGRLTGTKGEKKATAYVAAYLESLGLEPAGQNGTFFHDFEFVSNVEIGENNTLTFGDQSYEVNEDWRPVFFSKEGDIGSGAVVCAGYGIVAPEEAGEEEYDSYVHLDVKDKWVLVFRQMPQDISPERRQHLARYSGARYKAMVARDRGAKGLIFVSGPTSPLRRRLMPLTMDGTLGASSLAVVSIKDKLASAWMEKAGKDLRRMQSQLDAGEPSMGFELEGVTLSASIDIEPVSSRGRNVLALLPAGSETTEQMVLVGAHIDHLGTGQGSGSLAKEEEIGGVHRGADDNASGVGCVLEMAQYLAEQTKSGKLKSKRDILFAAWSGEELGLRGSAAFVDDFKELYPERVLSVANPHATPANPHATPANPHATPANPHAAPENPHAAPENPHAAPENPHAAPANPHAVKNPHGNTQETGSAPDIFETPVAKAEPVEGAHGGGGGNSLYPMISSALNLDMVGRLRENLVLQGIGSSPAWTAVIERRNAVVRLPLTLQNDCNLPTDASTFFLRGVPILSAFTGSHGEYHTPRDVPELLNYEGAAQVSRLMALITRDLVMAQSAPEFVDQPAEPEMRANLTAYLGTIPDYAQDEVQGVLLGGVTKGAPAEQGGMLGGDVIIELAGKKIENIYDYTYAIEALKIGQEISAKVQRGGKTIDLKITPSSRK